MESQHTHNDLWEQLRSGKDDALYFLYKDFYHRLFILGFAICREGESVKDAINQTFLYFWEKHETLGIAENVESYIISSFRRRLIAILNAQKKEIEKLKEWQMGEQEEVPSYEEYLVELQNRQELKKRMSEAISKLSKRKQELIRMHYYEGLSYEEIAAKTGLSIRTVYNKCHEAINSLRESLQPGKKGASLPISLLLLFYF